MKPVTFLKEINSACLRLSPDSITLFHSILDKETKEQVRNIAKKHSLALKEEKDKVIIYQPKEVTKTTICYLEAGTALITGINCYVEEFVFYLPIRLGEIFPQIGKLTIYAHLQGFAID